MSTLQQAARAAGAGDGMLTFRSAKPGDARLIKQLVHAAYEPWISRIGRAPQPMTEDYANVLQRRQALVAELHSCIVGVVVMSECSEGALIDNVAVLPALAHRGIGTALIARAEAHARTQGHAAIHLYAHVRMTENLALYQRLGYEEYKRVQLHGYARAWLRKRLA